MEKIQQQLLAFLKGLTVRQRIILAGSAVFVAGTLWLFVYLFGGGDYKPLYSGMAPADAQALGQKLGAQNISYQISPDGTTVLPAGADFLSGAMSWGVKSSPPIRSFGLAPVRPGQAFYVTDEAELTTWVGDVEPDGSLKNFRVFA